MSYEAIQRHLDENPVTHIGTGNTLKVYGTGRVAVKVQQINHQALMGAVRVCHPGATGIEADLLKDAMVKELVTKTRVNAVMGQETLGGLVVPFEFHPEVHVRIQEQKPRFEKLPFLGNITVEHPEDLTDVIIQQRFASSNLLKNKLRAAATAEDFDSVVGLIEALIHLHIRLLQNGAYPHDPLPENYAVNGNNQLQIHDIGAMTLSKKRVMITMKRARSGTMNVDTRRRKNLAEYHKILEPISRNDRVSEALGNLRTQMLDFEDPRYIDRVFGQTIRKATPVPQVEV